MKLDDLTIFLKAVDQTKRATESAKKNLLGVDKVGQKLKKTFKLIGFAAKAAFVAAIANGQRMANELSSVSRQLNIDFQETQALFNAVFEADRSANLDNLNEALLSLKERMADARLETGPLHGLLKDFDGFELDLGVTNARDQLANFLEEVSKLPTAEDRIFALKEVIGDEDARPFFNTINNTEKLNALLVDLRTNVEDVDDVLSDFEVKAIQDSQKASKELSKAWNDFSLEITALVAPAFELLLKGLTAVTDAATWAVDKVGNALVTIADTINDFLGRNDIGQGVQLTEDAARRVQELEIEAEKLRVEAEKDRKDLEIERLKKELKKCEEAKKKVDEAKLDLNPVVRTIAPRDPVPNVVVDGSGNTANDFIFNGTNINPALLDNGDTGALDPVVTEAEAANEALTGLGNTFGQLGGIMQSFATISGSNNEKAFRSFQKLQIALSTAAALSAAIQAASDPKLQGFAKLAAYSTVLGALLAGVAQLKQVSLGSGGNVSASAASAPSTPASLSTQFGAQSQTPSQSQGAREVNITINGVLGNDQLTTLAEQIANEINDNDNIRLAA